MGSFPGGKARLEHDADHSPHLVPKSRMSRSYTSSPPSDLHDVYRTALLFLLILTNAMFYSGLVKTCEKENIYIYIVVASHIKHNGPLNP
jgi:hypothetical protein